MSRALKINAAQGIAKNTQGQELRNLRACRKQTGNVQVMGWSGETSGMCFSAMYNINVQSKEESCDNPFISIPVFILALQDYSQKYGIFLTSNSNKEFSRKNYKQKRRCVVCFLCKIQGYYLSFIKFYCIRKIQQTQK